MWNLVQGDKKDQRFWKEDEFWEQANYWDFIHPWRGHWPHISKSMRDSNTKDYTYQILVIVTNLYEKMNNDTDTVNIHSEWLHSNTKINNLLTQGLNHVYFMLFWWLIPNSSAVWLHGVSIFHNLKDKPLFWTFERYNLMIRTSYAESSQSNAMNIWPNDILPTTVKSHNLMTSYEVIEE